MYELEGRIGNIKHFGVAARDRNDEKIILRMSRFSFAKLMPYLLKDKCLEGIRADFSNDFIKQGYYPDDAQWQAVGPETDINFYHYLQQRRINTESLQKTFDFIHLNCSHDVSVDLSLLYPGYAAGEADIYTTIRGGFEVMFEYFDQMKALGIYQNSTIIIVADHGRSVEGLLTDNQLKDAITSALLIKPKGVMGEPISFNDTAELSNANFAASILEIAGIESNKYGDSYFDIMKGNLHPVRHMELNYWHEKLNGWHMVGTLEGRSRYEIVGDARDLANWTLIEAK